MTTDTTTLRQTAHTRWFGHRRSLWGWLFSQPTCVRVPLRVRPYGGQADATIDLVVTAYDGEVRLEATWTKLNLDDVAFGRIEG